MVKPFILAKDLQEAKRIAGLVGYEGHGGWIYLHGGNTPQFRGTRGRVVLATSMDCWRSTRTLDQTLDLGQALQINDCRVIPVPCPLEWERMDFTLPGDWAVPKSYEPKVVLHPGKHLSWIGRLRQALWGVDTDA